MKRGWCKRERKRDDQQGREMGKMMMAKKKERREEGKDEEESGKGGQRKKKKIRNESRRVNGIELEGAGRLVLLLLVCNLLVVWMRWDWTAWAHTYSYRHMD